MTSKLGALLRGSKHEREQTTVDEATNSSCKSHSAIDAVEGYDPWDIKCTRINRWRAPSYTQANDEGRDLQGDPIEFFKEMSDPEILYYPQSMKEPDHKNFKDAMVKEVID